MKPFKDYQFIRGFNYTQSDVWTDTHFWENYNHAIVDRDLGYAERLKLNSARIFLTYSSYIKNPELFLANVRDFIQTAWQRGISTNPIIYHGFRFHPDDQVRRDRGQIPKTLLDKSCWALGERYFDALYEAIGQEPGLLFWDISNEPGYRLTDNSTGYPEEPGYIRENSEPHDPEDLRYRQELVWEIVRHFCKYVKARDPVNAIGVGNTFIYETEASKTADLVDIIVFHDYSETRARVREMYDMAKALGEKYGKPVINNETCCLCRANPYDMVLELISEYPFGWYAFELMIGKDVWNRVHGIVYPDGTIRDPSTVAALFGFYRNRGESAIYPDINQEGHADKALQMARKAINNARNGFRGDKSNDCSELLIACEFMANLLEAGEHVAMALAPTARIAAFRQQEHPDVTAVKTLLDELAEQLKKTCHLI